MASLELHERVRLPLMLNGRRIRFPVGMARENFERPVERRQTFEALHDLFLITARKIAPAASPYKKRVTRHDLIAE